MVIIVIASIATLSYFGSTRGYIEKTGNRRAALERARQRLDQLMASKISDLPQPDGKRYCCNTAPTASCVAGSWTVCLTDPVAVSDTVPVGNFTGGLRRETTAQFIDDPSAGTNDPVTGAPILDVYEFTVKVWFTSASTDDDFNRVYMQTLRTPS